MSYHSKECTNIFLIRYISWKYKYYITHYFYIISMFKLSDTKIKNIWEIIVLYKILDIKIYQNICINYQIP